MDDKKHLLSIINKQQIPNTSSYAITTEYNFGLD